MKFELNEKELEKFNKWNEKHKKNCPLYGKDGAIGGRLNFCFTPTGLGYLINVKCKCGKEINLTDFSDW